MTLEELQEKLLDIYDNSYSLDEFVHNGKDELIHFLYTSNETDRLIELIKNADL